jgi:hypothetical protein
MAAMIIIRWIMGMLRYLWVPGMDSSGGESKPYEGEAFSTLANFGESISLSADGSRVAIARIKNGCDRINGIFWKCISV